MLFYYDVYSIYFNILLALYGQSLISCGCVSMVPLDLGNSKLQILTRLIGKFTDHLHLCEHKMITCMLLLALLLSCHFLFTGHVIFFLMLALM